jgi:hypothetical protein
LIGEIYHAIKNCREDFIRKFQVKVNWEMISEYQKLSEDFIRENKHKFNLFFILCYQDLSEDFIDRYLQNDLNELISREDLPTTNIYRFYYFR